MAQEKERVPSMLSSTTWRQTTKSLSCFWKRPPITKTSKMLKSWEKLNIYLSKALETSVTLSVLKQKSVKLKPKTRICLTPTSGFQQKRSRKLKNSNRLLMVRCLKLAFLRFFTSSILFGVISWGKKIKPSKESSLFKCRTSVDSLWRRKPSMRTSLKEKFPDWRKSSSSCKCKFTTKKDKLSRMRTRTKITCQVAPRTNWKWPRLCKSKEGSLRVRTRV